MNLDVKKAFGDVLKLKYFWVYLFISTVFVTLSSIVQSAKIIPLNNVLSNIISVLTYISMGYIFIMLNNLLNDRDLNDENETFLQNLWNSTKKGLKAFVGTLANTLIVFVFSSIVTISGVFIFIKATGNDINENKMFSFPLLNVGFLLLVIVLSVLMIFVLKLLPVAYSKEFSLKEMFCWRKVFRSFFKKGSKKETIVLLSIYVLSMILLFLMLFAFMFLFNFLLVFTIKKFLVSHYAAVAFLINVSGVITPFVTGMVHFFVQSVIFHLLAQIYKREVTD